MPLADLTTPPFLPGTILYVKTTDEPVVYLCTTTRDFQHEPEDVQRALPGYQVFRVRRPIQTRDGLQYDLAVFFEFELESAQIRDARLLDELKRRNAMTKEALEDPSSEPRPTNFLKN